MSAAAFMISWGCGSPQQRHIPSDRPSFFEPEIRTRMWVHLDGAAIHFLGATITNLGAHGEMMIARFGDTNQNLARCLEFYRINRKIYPATHDTFVLIDHDWGPREQGYWPSAVISVEPIILPDHVSFRVTREALPGQPAKGGRLLYYLDYRAGAGITPNMSEWWIEGP